MPRFRYQIVLDVIHTEDNPDMPTLNVNTLAEALAAEARVLLPGLETKVVQARYIQRIRRS